LEKHRFNYFASCPSGLEAILAAELKSFGGDNLNPQHGGVAFETPDSMVALKALLRSRVASRIFKLLYSFEAHSENSMYQDLADIQWKAILEVQQTFRLTTIYGRLPHDRDVFTNSQFTTLKAKDAIVDWFNHHEGSRPSVDKDNPDISLLLRIDDAGDHLYKVQLLHDLSGNPLSQRGYRVAMTEAPLKENLAAGILQLVGWDPKVEGLVDGMCGSGTFVIEAALMAGGVSPQYIKLKHWQRGHTAWAFLASQWFTKDKYLPGNFQQLAREIMQADEEGMKRLHAAPPHIAGHDINPMVLKATRENLKTAGLAEVISIMQKNAEDSQPQGEKCLFIANPPYGERLMAAQEEDLRALYRGIGENWKKNWKGHRAVVLTGNLPLLKSISLRTSRKTPIFNGDIECRVAEYSLY
jgi:putative N6-adenine-specific DNA methylase